MPKDFKLIIVVPIIIGAVICMGSIVTLFILLTNERTEKTMLQNKLAQVMKEKKKLSYELEEMKLIKGDLEIKLSGLEAQAKMLAESYEKEKSQNDIVKLRLSEKEEELKVTKMELESVQSEKKKLQTMLEDEKTKYNQLKERVDKLVEVKNALEEKVRDIIDKQGIELERIVVKAEGELEGKVLVVNREYNFIVVDIGIRDDIELGDTLLIFRNGKNIGEAQVEKVYGTMSAATIVKEIKSGAILADDNVIVQGN
jgi:uncharacterized protein (DUF3084 family)